MMEAIIKYVLLPFVAIRGFLARWQRRQLSVDNPLVQLYLQAAMQQAVYSETPEEHSFSGEIPGFRGVYGYGGTVELARKNLMEALTVWVVFRLEYELSLPWVISAGHAVSLDSFLSEQFPVGSKTTVFDTLSLLVAGFLSAFL